MPTFTISDLAREFDVTPRAIRFYEDQGLLAPERVGSNGRQRRYSPRDRTRLVLTLRGKRLGLSLSDIKALLDMYESPADSGAQLRSFLAVLAHNRQRLEQQLVDIRDTLAEIDEHEARARDLLSTSR